MGITRRNLLRQFGMSAVASATIHSFSESTLAGKLMPSRSSQPGGPTLLNQNVNPYGPSKKVMAAIEESLSLVGRFPDSQAEALLSTIAGLHGVKTEQVILGCGSTEILRMATAAFLGPGKKLLMASLTYDRIARYANTLGSAVVLVALNKEYAHDLDAMLLRVDRSVGLVYICNPNNPTGSLTPRKDLETFIRKLPETTHVIIDEAYHHYVGGSSVYASFIDHPLDDSRAIVTRTFSKIYGLAGIRVGYAIAAAQTARRISSHRLLDGVNVIAASAARTALDDVEHVRISAQRNADDRQEFFNQVNARMLRAIDSHTNFVMLNTGRPADEVIKHFRKNNVLVAQCFSFMENYIRVSLGKTEEMLEFWRVWDLLPPHKMSM